jgi:hypothetical protein
MGLFVLSHIQSICKKVLSLETVMNLHIFSLIGPTEKWFLEYHLIVWMDGWMCTVIVPELLDILYSYSIFKSLSILGPCRANMSILVPKNTGSKTQNGSFLQNDCFD